VCGAMLLFYVSCSAFLCKKAWQKTRFWKKAPAKLHDALRH